MKRRSSVKNAGEGEGARGSSEEAYIIARCSPEEHSLYHRVAKRLGVSLSALILRLLDQVAGRLLDEGWECHVVHLDLETGKIRGVGVEPVDQGISPSLSFPIVAPVAFFVFVTQKLR